MPAPHRLLLFCASFLAFLPLTARSDIQQQREGYGEKEVLFAGVDTDQWRWHHDGSPILWHVVDEALEVLPVEGHRHAGDGSIITKNTYEDFYLHLEFKPNVQPTGGQEQDRGNSGVMLQDRYELQILDSYEHPLKGRNDCAAFYAIKDADVNVSKPAGEWQTYDIFFTAARWKGKQKVSNARATVYWNGVLVHDDVELPRNTPFTKPESPAPGPIRLQEHANPVQFRNIWIARPTTERPTTTLLNLSS